MDCQKINIIRLASLEVWTFFQTEGR